LSIKVYGIGLLSARLHIAVVKLTSKLMQ